MIKRHANFFLALVVGAALLALGVTLKWSVELCALVGAVGFFVSYLALMLRRAAQATPTDLRRHAATEDEGLPLILLLAIMAVGISLTAIALVLNVPGGSSLALRLFALAAVPLGWAMMHILLGFHYAHLFYRPEQGRQKGGLAFPGTETPDAWDFLYFSFGIAMTAQVSDVVITLPAMRRMVTLHAIASFFYNTVILALAVNAAVTTTL